MKTNADERKVNNSCLNDIIFGVNIQITKIKMKEVENLKISDCLIYIERITLYMDEMRLLIQEEK